MNPNGLTKKQEEEVLLEEAMERAKMASKGKAGVCPNLKCKFDQPEYNGGEINGETYSYDCFCPKCGTTWDECHDLVFSENVIRQLTFAPKPVKAKRVRKSSKKRISNSKRKKDLRNQSLTA